MFSPITLRDLIEKGLLGDGELLVYRHGGSKKTEATLGRDGTITLPTGETCSTPSEAACAAAQVGTADGWNKWRVPRLDWMTVGQLRASLVDESSA